MLELKDICFTRDNKKILDHVSLTLETDQFIAITGPNGSRKIYFSKNHHVFHNHFTIIFIIYIHT